MVAWWLRQWGRPARRQLYAKKRPPEPFLAFAVVGGTPIGTLDQGKIKFLHVLSPSRRTARCWLQVTSRVPGQIRAPRPAPSQYPKVPGRSVPGTPPPAGNNPMSSVRPGDRSGTRSASSPAQRNLRASHPLTGKHGLLVVLGPHIRRVHASRHAVAAMAWVFRGAVREPRLSPWAHRIISLLRTGSGEYSAPPTSHRPSTRAGQIAASRTTDFRFFTCKTISS